MSSGSNSGSAIFITRTRLSKPFSKAGSSGSRYACMAGRRCRRSQIMYSAAAGESGWRRPSHSRSIVALLPVTDSGSRPISKGASSE